MRNRTLLLCLAPLLCRADDLDNLRLRWRQTLTGGAALDSALPAVRSRLSSIESTARSQWNSLEKFAARTTLWTDIARTNISADISSSYGRLRDMAVAWATPGQGLYQDAALLADIVSGLEWMDGHRYNARSSEYDNWWDWEIGTPAQLVDIAILLYDQLSAEQLARYMAAVERFDSNPSVMIVNTVSTGANLADKCKIALLRGVLVKDAAKVSLAVSALSPVFAYVTAGDGFYLDGSFLQHTRHPYTGSYGVVLLNDVANLLYLLAGSPWDVKDAGRANVARWVADGFAPLLYRGALMDMVRGRAISRSGSSDHATGHSTIGYLLRITQYAPPAEAVPLRSAIKRWLQDDTSRDYSSGLALDLIGDARRILDDPTIAPAEMPYTSRVYASMDRVVHLRPTWAAGIAMHSTRIYNYESINSENLKGWHTSDGMVYLYNADLTQFADTFWPTVNAQRLPGTTVIAGATARQSQVGGSNIVGGTSLEGYSAAMMLLQPDGRQLSARKSWFLFDNELVALGADIRSTAAGQAVETIVENRRLTASAAFTSDPDFAWAHLAGANAGASIGYVFPGKAPWKSLKETRPGAWSEINAGGSTTALSATYQTLWFDHSLTPAAAAYSYILLPGKSAAETAAYAAAPAVETVQNDADAQAVSHGTLGIRAVNFWTPGKTVAGITSDAVASVLAHQANGLLTVAVSDPTQANTGTIHVTLDTAVSAVALQDNGVTVDQTAPSLKLSVNVRNSAGEPFRLTARTVPAGVPPVLAAGSAASGAPVLAPESLASAFGANLAQRTILSTVTPLPTALNDVSLEVRDAAGDMRLAPLILISPGQVNFQIPKGTAAGAARLTLQGGPVGPLLTTVPVQPIAPGLFAANSNGKGVAAAVAIRVDERTKTRSPVEVFRCSGACAATPILLTADSAVYVSLYGTGIRGPGGAPEATCTVHGVAVPVLYAGAQPQYQGLDQVDISLPATLAGRGESDVVLTVNGQTANTVTLNIQ
ncbi:MAG: polysaccharide lyase beta-sandwich domain-containing protein [Candidatus Solibacter sp.]|nr:polysaccharide lyase beta-sandwich domain-containing protein [Candidatus Solibacter sp.]